MNKYIFLTVTACAAIGAVWTGCGGSSTTGGTGGAGGKPTSSTSKTSTTKASSTTGPTAGSGGAGGGFGGAGGGAPVGITCNPVTNSGCQAGEACDIATDQTGSVIGFQCYQPPNTAATCATCDPTGQTGPFCMGGGTCFPNAQQTSGECAHYCCTDGDCGTDGACDVKDMLFGSVAPTLGLCVAKPSTGTGGSGTGGSGTGGHGTGGSASSSSSSGSASSSTTSSGAGGSGAGGGSGEPTFACNPPATAPSNGSCVTVTM